MIDNLSFNNNKKKRKITGEKLTQIVCRLYLTIKVYRIKCSYVSYI